MPDTSQITEPTISNFSPEVSYMPDTGMPKMDELDNWQNKINMQDLGPTGQEYAQSISSGESITDLVKDVQDIQARGMSMLDNSYSAIPNSPSPGGFDPNKSFEDLAKKLNPETPSLSVLSKPVIIGKSSDLDRYSQSKYFQTFGYTPNLGSEQEYKYGNAQTWKDTIGNALAGGGHLAYDTFVEGWKGWGRMAEALFTWDSSKLMGTPEEREEMARKQNELMNKYAIYDTAESRDSLWNRQFFGNMLQQSGFAVGAIGQFALEEYLTAGAATLLEPVLKGVMVGRVARTAEEAEAIRAAAGLGKRTTILGRAAEGVKDFFRPQVITTADELINSTREVANTVTKSERVVNAIADGLKALTPGYGTVEEMIKLNKAGAGFAQLAYTGLGGIKRGLSEFNMARSESIFEAASTYTQLKDRLTDEFIQTNGRAPSDIELEKIKQSAENASRDNFAVNMGVLMVMNRIQFDNMFKQFSKTRSLLGEGIAQLEGKAFQVTGKVEGKTTARVYKEGLLGRFGAIPEIAKTFGKKQAAWEATKAVGKGLMHFEGSEGMQELIQNASDKGLEDYYYNLYHGKKGYTGKLDAVVKNMQNPLKDMEGMKTFLMGALTGRLIAPISFGFEKTSGMIRDRNNIKKAQEKYQAVYDDQVNKYTEKNGKAPEGEDLDKIKFFAKTTTEYKTLSQHVDESVGLLNALYSNPQWLKNEALANIKVNNKAAADMDEAAANHDRYVFNNIKDSALAKAVASAIKLDLYSSMRDVIKEYGAEFSDEEFKQAFGIEPTAKNRDNAKKLAENVVSQIEDYYETYKKLEDKYGDRIIPDLYKNNKPEDYKNAKLQKAALSNTIEIIATNAFKAKRAIVRASQLQSEIGQNTAIGSSTLQVITTIGNDSALIEHTQSIIKRLTEMDRQETKLTDDQQKLYKELKEELEHITNWYNSRKEIMENTSSEYSPSVETRAYKAFADLINLYNRKSNNTTAVSTQDTEEVFLKFIDYLKLNQDSQEYVDAMNLLADPKNMKLVDNANRSALEAMYKRFYEEHINEIEDATGILIPRHSYEKEIDDTYTIKSPDGIVVEKGIKTLEEAKIKANELDVKYREELARQEAETKAKEAEEEPEETTSDIETKKAEIEKERKEKLDNSKVVKGTYSSFPFDQSGFKVGDGFQAEYGPGVLVFRVLRVDENGKILDAYIDDASKKYYLVIKDGKNQVGYGAPYQFISDVPITSKTVEDVINENYDAELATLEGKGSEVKKLSAEELIDKIGKVKTQVELDELKKDLDKGYTDKEVDDIEKVIEAKEEELRTAAIKAGTLKTISDTDPEFTAPYNEALQKIEKIVNDPNVTLAQIRTAFFTLSPIFAKLDPETKVQYAKLFAEKRREVEERVKAEIQSKDIEGAKKMITKSLESDTTPLHVSFEQLYTELNLKLKPEFKKEAIEHFEKEYLKAIDRKINKLFNQLNTSNSSEALTKLIMLSSAFRSRVEKNLDSFKQKSQEIRDLKGGLSYIVEVDEAFDNPTHRSIISSKDGSATSGQRVAINNFMISGMLSQEDLNSYDIGSKHGASEVINLAVARMLTLQINKAAAEHFRKGSKSSASLEEALRNYLSDMYDYNTKELNAEVSDLLDKDNYPDLDSLLQELEIPKTRELSEEEYKLINIYRKSVAGVIKESAVIDILDEFQKHQQDLLTKNEKVSSEDIIPFELIKNFKSYLEKDESGKVQGKKFYEALIKAFDQLKEVKTAEEATKIIRDLSSEYMVPGGSSLALLQSLLANSLQAYNLLNSESDGSQPLTEEDMIQILDGVKEESLNKEQIAQIESYAKSKKLDEYKSKFNAAVGYTAEGPVFTYEEKVPTSSAKGFNSLRAKSANDVRTAKDLAVYLMPDENGMVSLEYALNFVLYSSYSTPAEKALAKRFLEYVSPDEMLKIDNSIDAAGEFDADTNLISINLEAAGYKKGVASVPVETVILHELVHLLTEKAISDPNSAYTKEIRSLYNLIKTKEGANTFYAYSEGLSPEEQIREFLTEAFTNPSFQYLLATTPYGKTNKTAWDKFLDFVNSILEAIGVDINGTVLGQVISLTDNLLNKNAIIEADVYPSEAVMEDIKKAATEEDLNKIREQLLADKDKFTPDMYSALEAAIKNKAKGIIARNLSDAVKDMESIKIDKTTYYYTNDSGIVKVYKKGRTKINEVKTPEILAKVAEEISKKFPTPPPAPIETTGKNVTVFSDLSNKEYVEDPSVLDFSTVDSSETITAVDPNGLRSKGNDGRFINGEYKEYDSFTKFYYKVRDIINKLSNASPEELDILYVTLDKDSAGFRWDGSAQDEGWINAEKGVVGYISDRYGNPIVFDKNGKAIGKADRNNPAASRFNTGENQIVYFNTYTEKSDQRSLDRVKDKESLNKLFAARKAVMEGRPQIAKVQKVTKGQMVLGAMVKPNGKSQKNTARDKEFSNQLNQDHVSLELVGGHLNAFIEDADGVINRTVLFPPNSRAVKVVGLDGQSYTLFDHLIQLMEAYHELEAAKDPNLANIQRDLAKFAQNMWLTGDRYSLKIPKNFMGIWIKVKGEDGAETQVRMPIFEMKNGVLTINQDNLKAVKNHVENMKINVSKNWLQGKEDFKFPYIIEKDGKKMINFEKMNYKDFLLNNVGLISYISDVPTQENIKRYNSNVHFLDPVDLAPKPSSASVTEKQVADNQDATKKAVDDAVKNAVVPEDKTVVDPSKRKRFRAPSYEQTFQETYKKECK